MGPLSSPSYNKVHKLKPTQLNSADLSQLDDVNGVDWVWDIYHIPLIWLKLKGTCEPMFWEPQKRSVYWKYWTHDENNGTQGIPFSCLVLSYMFMKNKSHLLCAVIISFLPLKPPYCNPVQSILVRKTKERLKENTKGIKEKHGFLVCLKRRPLFSSFVEGTPQSSFIQLLF